MVVEGIITTEEPDGSMHVAPIGPHVDESQSQWTLKPFQSSRTFANLHRTQRGVFHIVDDALLMVRAVLGLCNGGDNRPNAFFHQKHGWVLEDCCHFVALSTVEWDLTHDRATARCALVHRERGRDFWGWNRAAHSLLELSVIASRVHLMEQVQIAAELAHHRIIIEKTAGPREQAAWELLKGHLSQ